MKTIISLIASVTRNNAIGRDGGLVWQDAADLRHFRDTTMGCPVVMGRRTWQALPARVRPLPGRHNVVVTRNAGLVATGADCVTSLDAAMTLLQGSAKVYVIGGAQLYAQALPLADELVLTEIDATLDGDTFFPAWNAQDFVEVERRPGLDAAGVPYSFVTYRRRVPPLASTEFKPRPGAAQAGA